MTATKRAPSEAGSEFKQERPGRRAGTKKKKQEEMESDITPPKDAKADDSMQAPDASVASVEASAVKAGTRKNYNKKGPGRKKVNEQESEAGVGNEDSQAKSLAAGEDSKTTVVQPARRKAGEGRGRGAAKAGS